MKVTRISSRILPALTFACAIGMAPLAVAQTMAPTSTMSPMKPAAGKLPVADQFKTQAAATAHCPGDTVVWSSLSKTNSYHLTGSKMFGTTKHGAYVCKTDATTFGFHQAKN